MPVIKAKPLTFKFYRVKIFTGLGLRCRHLNLSLQLILNP